MILTDAGCRRFSGRFAVGLRQALAPLSNDCDTAEGDTALAYRVAFPGFFFARSADSSRSVRIVRVTNPLLSARAR